MKKLLTLCIIAASCFAAQAQLSVRYDNTVQPSGAMQYFRPAGQDLFVGDCIPFAHDGTYYLYWLIDSAHHSALNHLGGHQWVLSTTRDLKHWTHYPIVIGIDEAWEKSICTGSVVYLNKKFYAFYATRLISDGKVNEQLSYAISDDGIHFQKQQPNPFYTSAPGYSKRDFRDPKVFTDSAGNFHLFVSSSQDSAVMKGTEGALVHLVSHDLQHWQVKEPILTGQRSVPECPDYFKWNNWYYLVYSDNSNTFYVKSKSPYGPWQEPLHQSMNEDWANVVKTAEFGKSRRIAAAWIPNRFENKDNEHEIFGGNVVFRELVQEKDGSLNSKFPAELIPATGPATTFTLVGGEHVVMAGKDRFSITAFNGVGAAHIDQIPVNCRITLQITPQGPDEAYGMVLRAAGEGAGGYHLNFSPGEERVSLGNTSISGVSGLGKTISVDIILKDDIIDVCVDGRRCMVNRAIQQKGAGLWFYAKHGKVLFSQLKITPLLANQ